MHQKPRYLEARQELTEIRRKHARRVKEEANKLLETPEVSGWHAMAAAVKLELQKELEFDVLRWRIRFRDVATATLRQIEDTLSSFWRVRERGKALVSAEPGLAAGHSIRGFQVETPTTDPYRVGMDAPSDRYSAEELVLAHTGRAPHRWLPDEEEFQ